MIDIQRPMGMFVAAGQPRLMPPLDFEVYVQERTEPVTASPAGEWQASSLPYVWVAVLGLRRDRFTQ
jgi:hypothetical protein